MPPVGLGVEKLKTRLKVVNGIVPGRLSVQPAVAQVLSMTKEPSCAAVRLTESPTLSPKLKPSPVPLVNVSNGCPFVKEPTTVAAIGEAHAETHPTTMSSTSLCFTVSPGVLEDIVPNQDKAEKRFLVLFSRSGNTSNAGIGRNRGISEPEMPA